MMGSASYGQLPATLPSHIVILIEENHSYGQIYGSSSAPHMNSLATNAATAPYTAVFSSCHALTHPSEPNYLDFYAGGNQGVTTDAVPVGYPFTTANLGAELVNAGKTFITYSEDLPSVGFDGASYTSGGRSYVRKHNPVANWIGTGTNQLPNTVNQPLTAFPSATNYSTLPTVCYVVPNQKNDMHDGVDPATIILGDQWYFDHLDSLRQWTIANNSLLIITFDEDADNTTTNQILTMFYGPMVKGGMYSESFNLYGLLRTIEDLSGLSTHAGAAASATTITDCWRNNVSVKNINENNSFIVYPNPASDVVTFKSNNSLTEAVNVIITDITGRNVGNYSMDADVLTVNTKDLSNGVYYYKVITHNQILDNGKMVINHN